MLTFCMYSVQDERLPEVKGRVRAECYKQILVFRPDKNL
jgi:hypothetical protein